MAYIFVNLGVSLALFLSLSPLQLYEFTLHCTQNSDHNVVTASLETLQQLLRTPPPNLKAVLLTPGSIQEKSIDQEGLTSDAHDVAKEAGNICEVFYFTLDVVCDAPPSFVMVLL